MSGFFAYRVEPACTVYRDIRRLRPGHSLELSNHRISPFALTGRR